MCSFSVFLTTTAAVKADNLLILYVLKYVCKTCFLMNLILVQSFKITIVFSLIQHKYLFWQTDQKKDDSDILES